jgi:hypothetical protein
VLLHGVDVGRGAVVRNAIIDKNVTIPPAPGSASTPSTTAPASTSPTVASSSSARATVSRTGGDVSTDRPRAARRPGLLTKEYPPEVYGGAGVHVAELARALADLVDLEVHCFGAERDDPLVAASYREWDALAGDAPDLAALRTVSADLSMVAGVEGVDLVHSHTWYANLAGHLAKLVHDVPHVVTTHSLEPLRPWKREQLGGGYALSSFCERTALEGADAIIAVSRGHARRRPRELPGVDPTGSR